MTQYRGLGDFSQTSTTTKTTSAPPSIGGPSPGSRDGSTESYPGQTAGVATPSNPTAPPPPATQTYDWTSDPIYQLVLGQQSLAIKQAQAAALTAETQALIAYGDSNLAFAVTGDKNVAAAAAANKASTLAQLAAQNSQNVRNTNEAENQKNLWYSSDRGYQLGLAQQTYLFNSAGALSNVQGNLGSISQNLLAQQQAAYAQEQNAAGEAYARAIANPVGLPSGDGSGSGANASGVPALSSAIKAWGGLSSSATSPAAAASTVPKTATPLPNKQVQTKAPKTYAVGGRI